MEAFKFLDKRGGTVLTGFRWPLPSGGRPGPWVEVTSTRPCHEGIHACTNDQLAYWISDDLWVVELDGPTVPGPHKVVAPRGRLLRRIDAWPKRLRHQLAVDAAWRTRDSAFELATVAGQRLLADRLAACGTMAELAELRGPFSGDVDWDGTTGIATLLAGDCGYLAEWGQPAEAPFVAACAAGHAAAGSAIDVGRYELAFHAERVRQSRWLAERIKAPGRGRLWHRRR